MTKGEKIGISLLLGGGVIAVWFFWFRPAPKEADELQSVFSQTPVVEATQARLGSMQHTLRLTGTLRPNDQAVIRSEVEARIKEIPFQEGTYVDKGALLIELDNTRAVVALKEAKSKLYHAKNEYERAKKLCAERLLSPSECDKRQAEMEAVQAQLELQESLLEKHTIRAPFDGMVGLKEISVGEFVTLGKELVVLVDYTPLKIDFKIPEMSLRHIRVGQTVQVYPNEFEQAFYAEVIAVSPIGDPSGHSFIARAVLKDQSAAMRPGGFAEVHVPIDEGDRTIIVPESAIERRGDVDLVYRIVDGLVVRTPVTTGERKDGEIEVLNGVDDGDFVITAGHMKARDNKPVIIKESVISSSEAEGKDQNAKSSTADATETDQKTGKLRRLWKGITGIFAKDKKEEAAPASAEVSDAQKTESEEATAGSSEEKTIKSPLEGITAIPAEDARVEETLKEGVVVPGETPKEGAKTDPTGDAKPQERSATPGESPKKEETNVVEPIGKIEQQKEAAASEEVAQEATKVEQQKGSKDLADAPQKNASEQAVVPPSAEELAPSETAPVEEEKAPPVSEDGVEEGTEQKKEGFVEEAKNLIKKLFSSEKSERGSAEEATESALGEESAASGEGAKEVPAEPGEGSKEEATPAGNVGQQKEAAASEEVAQEATKVEQQKGSKDLADVPQKNASEQAVVPPSAEELAPSETAPVEEISQSEIPSSEESQEEADAERKESFAQKIGQFFRRLFSSEEKEREASQGTEVKDDSSQEAPAEVASDGAS
ncbi:MAG: efflux RND transporter periplasmic adaptor subunit [Holosporales bacterium]|jgi:membrane fusion protein (multidrug efflux system)|nr:efflux RND transporter periplasmic adaptor subunit [Holosporales bacterium]